MAFEHIIVKTKGKAGLTMLHLRAPLPGTTTRGMRAIIGIHTPAFRNTQIHTCDLLGIFACGES